MALNIEQSAKAHAQALNPAIIEVGKSIGTNLLIGFTIVSLAIYFKK